MPSHQFTNDSCLYNDDKFLHQKTKCGASEKHCLTECGRDYQRYKMFLLFLNISVVKKFGLLNLERKAHFPMQKAIGPPSACAQLCVGPLWPTSARWPLYPGVWLLIRQTPTVLYLTALTNFHLAKALDSLQLQRLVRILGLLLAEICMS